ncbi:hypothetical protein M9H77_05690 [Catharanthus roseus]|uniref:Uncharacterized protein n=1 Tax=Catharanthus roseus TaxID=4058 RepID=A0ACC0CHY9_CATRO|nr:hypothetical protein M9H77_05690 [Catharanthus roseus]
MDPKYTGEMLRHLEKQDDLLMEAHRSMSRELHKLQIKCGLGSFLWGPLFSWNFPKAEEEMLMRKFYELMSAQGLTRKNDNENDAQSEGENDPGKALVCITPNE